MNAKIGEAMLSELKKIFANTYFDRAPRECTFPYAVFTTPTTFKTQDDSERIVMEVDVYDNAGNNISALETAVKNIGKGIHKAIYNDNKIMLIFYLESILHLDGIQENVRRRKLNFIVKYYNMEV